MSSGLFFGLKLSDLFITCNTIGHSKIFSPLSLITVFFSGFLLTLFIEHSLTSSWTPFLLAALILCFPAIWVLFLFFRLFVFRDRGKEEGKERNIDVCLPLTCPPLGTWPATQACALTGNHIGKTLVHRLVLSALSHTSQCESCMGFREFINSIPFVTRPAQAWSGWASGRPVLCGFFTLYKKDFTTRVQVILRLRLLRLGTVKTMGGFRVEEVTGESLGGALLGSLENL